jgi:type I site-specific restriction endonuclease
MPPFDWVSNFRKNIRQITHGDEESQKETKVEEQIRKARLAEIEQALIVLSAHVIRASKQFPKESEQVSNNFFNLHFGFAEHSKRIKNLHSKIEQGTEAYVKISCTQISALSSKESFDDIMEYLFQLAASDDFISKKEIKALHQISRYLKYSETAFHQLNLKWIDSSNPYVVLGVEENASGKEILAAYRKKVLVYHPDKCTLPISKEELAISFPYISKHGN